MESGLYFQPVGFLSFAELNSPDLLPLAGGPLYFTGGLILEREKRGVRSRYMTVRELRDVRSVELRDCVNAVTSSRSLGRFAAMRVPLIMGIVNVTPDSFSDGGAFFDPECAVIHARRLLSEGADILDIGGESTRPGSHPVSLEEERARVLPVLKELQKEGAFLSVDTRKASLMSEAAMFGVALINDISALSYDQEAASVLACCSCNVVLMHSFSFREESVRSSSHVVLDVYDALSSHIHRAESAGITRDRLIIDPGIGFGKTLEQNLELMRCLSLFHGLGVPLMLGVSRKKTIGYVTGVNAPIKRVAGSLSMGLCGAAQGVQILRVHDVAATRQALLSWLAVCGLS
ncbi:MAG: dihydropteroate synthase [Alphaproteobacteria bacterium]|nr:dihydropteroate synthase [Alphaproteobacteria bacterium]